MTAYILNLLVLISVYAILSTTLNFIIGYAGIFSLAHAVFFGIGGYTAALVAMHVSPEFFVAIPISLILNQIGISLSVINRTFLMEVM